MRDNLRNAVYATILYAAIFDYPLTESEIFRWLIWCSGKKNYDKRRLHDVLQNIPHERGYYAVSRSRIPVLVKKRQQREQCASPKWRIAYSVATILRVFPSIMLIGVSGGLSLNNVDPDDDIDLFIVVAPGTMWVSRLFVLFVLECLGKRRRFNSKEEKDLLCANMFVSEDQLLLPESQRDIYSAHEVLQMVPLFERNGCYQTFIQTNAWVRSFLPNAWEWRLSKIRVESREYRSTFYFLLSTLEPIAKWIQQKIMERHITTEIATDTTLKFHPHDARIMVKTRFIKALKYHNVPIDSKFFPALQ